MNDFGPSPASTRLPHLGLLLAFRTVAELGSFTRAANALHLSQSAISQQVVKLEEVLQSQLFERSTRSVVLTAAGKQLLDDLKVPLEQLIGALNRCSRRNQPPVLHIETEPVISAFWLTPRLRHFTKKFPEVQIQQILSTQRVEFPKQVEVAIKWGGEQWPGFDAEYFLSLNYVPVCSPALLEGSPPLRSPSDLAKHSLLHDRNYQDWKRWHAVYPDEHLNVENGHVVTDSNVLAQMAIEGYGVALCAMELIERQLRSGELVIPFPEMTMRHPLAYYILTRPQHTLSPTARSFIEWLRSMVVEP
ncbi:MULTISPECIES: LysR substrate-binding domain-containing protein [Pseudomonas]|uniref:Glycine cleavage system transcriptional activator n=1 Tax=Pseudomonas putida TaxID=303 RepID=A0A1B2F472_PSEPU|nr:MULTISPECIES: LysR substrate-binding domain-containing protein [Pseudomonas]ANY87062.1 Glycine cleavage system transcriptional activator [Pseudomonas putida]MCL8308871.1 LysR substrate-binding domain-containing protein [Pseudomonas putida]